MHDYRSFFHEEYEEEGDESWAGEWCVRLADEVHQGRARFITAACSQNKLTVSHFSVNCSEFNLELVRMGMSVG